MDKIMTVPEVAEYLKMSTSKVYHLVQRKQIPHLKIGRNVRIRESDLVKWVSAQWVEDQMQMAFPMWNVGILTDESQKAQPP
jgi:excisionase family DNA binding protein